MAREENSSHGGGLSAFQMQALTGHLERLFNTKFEELHERMDTMQNQVTRGQHVSQDETNYQSEEEETSDQNTRRRRNIRHNRRSRNSGDELRGINIKIPSFQGRSDPQAYLEWAMRVEQIFSCHTYSEGNKVKLAALEFTDYALVWWDQLQKDRARNGEQPIRTWAEMKAIMRRRFVPSFFHRELHNKLQSLTQGSKSVDEYHKEMEMAMIQANIVEDQEATMARFLNGLNRDIVDAVEMYHYVELQELVHQQSKWSSN